jgi:ribonuclease G
MSNLLLINRATHERRVALIENGVTTELFLERVGKASIAGNIYKGRVVRVLPGMQSAFIDIGLTRAAFLFVGDLVKREESNAKQPNEDSDAPPARPTYPPIASLIKQGQDIVVQVAKEPIGTKGARVTTQIGLPGRYLVLSPYDSQIGVSRRIQNQEERDRLTDLAQTLQGSTGGLIVRTVAQGLGEDEFGDDLRFLQEVWKEIEERVKSSSPPALLYEELDVTRRSLRDLVHQGLSRILVDDEEEAERIKEFISRFMPAYRGEVEFWKGPDPLFERFGLEWEISRATRRKVWLKSGGYIIIDRTEALTSIDVNTGRFVGKNNFEETILETNVEAVREIAYQLRLRDIGGIVVIDFVDMEIEASKQRVQDSLREALANDRARTFVLPMSALGLVEMTRKRVRDSLIDELTESCHYCDGKGYLKSVHVMVTTIISGLHSRLACGHRGPLAVLAHPTITSHLAEVHQEDIASLEKEHNVTIELQEVQEMHFEQYEIR